MNNTKVTDPKGPNQPGLPKLLVKVWSTPFQSLVNVSMFEKIGMESEIEENFRKFIYFILFPLNSVKPGNVEKMQNAEQLVKSE